MDVRTPDAYKTETLVSPLEPDEIELAILASLEEERNQFNQCTTQWDSFQGILERLKRIGKYDKQVFHAYELLSVHLYKYSYSVQESVSEDTYSFLQTHLKGIRFTEMERTLLSKALTRLRYGS